MRKSLKLALSLAFVCAVVSSDALAKSKQSATGQVTATQSDDFPIPLPHNLTTGKDWLDDGSAPDAAKGNLQPNRYANDNYFLEQQDFSLQRSAALQ